jgi:DNA-binding transcriptional MerR regulator
VTTSIPAGATDPAVDPAVPEAPVPEAPAPEAPAPEAPAPEAVVDGARFSIAEAAARSGLSVDTLRYYERIGLIDPPARTSAGRRSYRAEDLAWLDFLTRMRATGLPLRAMREYAGLRRTRTPASTTRRRQILLDYRYDVLARMAELTSCLEALDYKIENYGLVERKLAAVSPAPSPAS